jgi:hypothetical protein
MKVKKKNKCHGWCCLCYSNERLADRICFQDLDNMCRLPPSVHRFLDLEAGIEDDDEEQHHRQHPHWPRHRWPMWWPQQTMHQTACVLYYISSFVEIVADLFFCRDGLDASQSHKDSVYLAKLAELRWRYAFTLFSFISVDPCIDASESCEGSDYLSSSV